MDNIASLVCHSDTPSGAVEGIIVSGERALGGFITVRYHVSGDITRLVIPAQAEPGRADVLWATTCFELFTQDAGEEAYREYNFSPSRQWAAYGFDGYREGMRAIDIWAPRITTSIESNALVVDATFVSPRLGPQMVGASAVIEEVDGTKSFWALRHPPGKPDFHHADCLAFELPASDGDSPNVGALLSYSNDR